MGGLLSFRRSSFFTLFIIFVPVAWRLFFILRWGPLNLFYNLVTHAVPHAVLFKFFFSFFNFLLLFDNLLVTHQKFFILTFRNHSGIVPIVIYFPFILKQPSVKSALLQKLDFLHRKFLFLVKLLFIN